MLNAVLLKLWEGEDMNGIIDDDVSAILAVIEADFYRGS
jgi:hypothetical protein